jgi:branched-chain amino acid transport system substrate-binding protein
VPCITSDDPWQAWFFGRKGDPKKGFEWTYHFFWGFDMVANMFAEMWKSMPTNKKVGVLFTNDPDGVAASDPVHGLPATIKSHGFDVTTSASIRRCRTTSPRKSRHEEGERRHHVRHFQPAAIRDLLDAMRAARLQAEDRDAAQGAAVPDRRRGLGDRGAGMSTEVWWSHHHPFKSGLTGQTAQQYCDAYEKASGKQWTQPLGFKHANLEVAIDVLKRAKKLEPPSRSAIRSRRPTTSRSSARSPGRAARPIRCRMCAPRRWSAASGKRARSGSTT